MRHAWAWAVCLGAGLLQVPALAADAASAELSEADQERLAQMVQAEVQRQLPAAVEKAIREYVTQQEKVVAARQAEAIRKARSSYTASKLQTLRSQLELYKIQHADQIPSLELMRDWAALAKKTQPNGQVAADGKYGPYLDGPPVNPFNGKTRLVAVGKAEADAGWTYDPVTGAIRAVVSEADLKDVGDLTTEDYEVIKSIWRLFSARPRVGPAVRR